MNKKIIDHLLEIKVTQAEANKDIEVIKKKVSQLARTEKELEERTDRIEKLVDKIKGAAIVLSTMAVAAGAILIEIFRGML